MADIGLSARRIHGLLFRGSIFDPLWQTTPLAHLWRLVLRVQYLGCSRKVILVAVAGKILCVMGE
jgi:hypothetical protein